MKKGLFLFIFVFSACGPWEYNARFIKVPNTQENLKIARECQNSIATALSYNASGVKYRCYSTFQNTEEKITKFVSDKSDKDAAFYVFIKSHIPKGCTYLDKQCNPEVYYPDSDCIYVLCDPNAEFLDKIDITKDNGL